jgi:hypothetical protein
MTYDGTSVFFVRYQRTPVDFPYYGGMFSIAANSVTTEFEGYGSPRQIAISGMVNIGDIIYGVDSIRRLWKFDTVLNMHINRPVGDGESIKSMLSRILQSFNLIGTISANKTAIVYRRGNDAGDLQNTGNALALTQSNVANISSVVNDYRAVAWVSVTSGDTTYSYDGTTYNAGILSDARSMEVSNDLIPEELVQDVCKYFYNFYKNNHTRYIFEVNAPLMQYEPVDEFSIATTTTKILVNSVAGLILAQTINENGSMTIEGII